MYDDIGSYRSVELQKCSILVFKTYNCGVLEDVSLVPRPLSMQLFIAYSVHIRESLGTSLRLGRSALTKVKFEMVYYA